MNIQRAFALLTCMLGLLSSARAADAAATTESNPGLALYWKALVHFRSPVEAELAQGRQLLEQASGLQCGEAQALLGSAMLHGTYGFRKEPTVAIDRLQQAIAHGNDFARVALGECFFRGMGAKVDLAMAEKLLASALAPEATFMRPTPPAWFLEKMGDTAGVAGELESDPVESTRAYAHHLLGQIAQQRGDHALAQEHFLAATRAGRAGRAGIYEAAMQAALNCAFGRGVARDRAQAVALLETARELQRRQGAQNIHGLTQQGTLETFAVADLEESIAESSRREMAAKQTEIGDVFAQTTSEFHDFAEARIWYELAAGNDDASGMLHLALMQSRGVGGPVDRAAAFGWFEKAGGGQPPLVLHGVACLAIAHLRGLGTPVDATKAKALFARWRDDDFLCYLGASGEAPLDVVSADEARAMLETRATKKKDVHAQYLVAKYHLWGRGYPANAEEGVKLLKRAADRGSGAACGEMGDYYEFGKGDPREAKKYYERGKRRKDARSVVGLARQVLRPGNGSLSVIVQSGTAALAKAMELCDDALSYDPDHVAAHELKIEIGVARVNGVDMQTGRLTEQLYDQSTARKHALAAEKLGSGLAAYYLGRWALHGEGETKDTRRAYDLLSTAGDRGYPSAHLVLGEMHERGDGVPETPEEAAYHYRLAAIAGNNQAARHLAKMYRGGRGVPPNPTLSIFWYSILARSGTVETVLDLAKALVHFQREREAIPLLEEIVSKASNWHRALAHAELARCYRLGLGVEADATKSRMHRREAWRGGVGLDDVKQAKRAAEEGDMATAIQRFEQAAEVQPEACFRLGQIHHFGQSVDVDKTKAMAYLRRAAADDYADALYFLAGLTVNREADAPPVAEALDMARRALAMGNEKARDVVRILEARLAKDSP